VHWSPTGAHSASPRAPLRRSWGHCATRAGPLRGLRGRSSAALTGTTLFMQPVFVSTAQIAATLTPTLSAASRR